MTSDSVDDIRRQIDGLDNRIHDLLMERADLVLRIGEEKRRNNIQVIQPDREIVMLRRLLARHKGPLPSEAVVRIWRELVGAVSLLQTGLKVAVTVPDDSTLAVTYWDMAKDYFSSVLPMQKANNALAALSLVRENEVTFAVVPWPTDEDANPWWGYLMDDTGGGKIMRIVARLPLGDRKSGASGQERKALVVARLDHAPSGDDRSFVGLKIGHGVSRTRIIERCRKMELEVLGIYNCGNSEKQKTLHLVEINSYIEPGDQRLQDMLSVLESPDGRAVCLGGYPVPPVYEDKVGKSAEPAKSEKQRNTRKSA